MKPFSYLTPTSVEEASRLLDQHGDQAMVIAGGQTLLLALKDRTARPAYLVSLARIANLDGIRTSPDGELVVGATRTYAALCRDELSGWHSEVAAVAGDLADRPVRTMGTIGGALCAVDPRFDMQTLVVGTDARLDVAGPDGTRTVTTNEFFAPDGGNRLKNADVLTAVRFPPASAYTSVTFRKFRQRTFDAALASALVAARRADDGTLEDVRITVGAVHPVPVVAERTVQELRGKAVGDIDPDTLTESVVDEVFNGVGDQPSSRYQRELVRSLTREVLIDTFKGTREELRCNR